MRKVKRILALSMVCILALGLMVTAGAHTYKDQLQIDSDYQAAVDMLYALGVATGDQDNNLLPKSFLRRSEMAKIMYVIDTGGKTDASLFANYESSKFNDVPSDQWYAGFVNYCEANKLVQGTSATTFSPNRNMLVAEAAKLMLSLIGYMSEYQNYTDAGWEIRVMAQAEKLGLFDGLKGITGPMAPITREQFFQMIYNGLLKPETVKYNTTYVPPVISATGMNLLEQNFKADIVTGLLEANEFAAVVGGVTATGKIRVDGDIYTTTASLDMIGREVKLFVKGATVLAPAVLTNSDSVITVPVNKVAATINVGGTNYTGGTDATTFLNFQTSTLVGAAGAPTSNIANVIVKDNAIQYILAQDLTFGKVSLAADGKVAVTPYTGGAALFTGVEPAKILNKDLAKKDALVMAAEISASTYVLYETTVAEGTVTRINSDGTVVLNGSTYTVSNFDGAAPAAPGYVTLGSGNSYYTYGSLLMGAVDKPVDPTKYAVLVDTEWVGTALSAGTPYAKVFLQDGTAVVNKVIAKYNGTEASSLYKTSVVNGYGNPSVSLATGGAGAIIPKVQLCTYSLDNDDKITLTVVAGTVAADTDTAYTSGGSSITVAAATSRRVNADSLFFVLDKDTWKFFKGRSLPTFAATTSAPFNTGATLSTSKTATDNDTVTAAVYTVPAGLVVTGSDTSRTGILLGAGLVPVGDKNYAEFQIAVDGKVGTYYADKLANGTAIDNTNFNSYSMGSLITISAVADITVDAAAADRLVTYTQKDANALNNITLADGAVFGYFSSYDATNKDLVLEDCNGAVPGTLRTYDVADSAKLYTVAAGVVAEGDPQAAASKEIGKGNVVALIKDNKVVAVYCQTDGVW